MIATSAALRLAAPLYAGATKAERHIATMTARRTGIALLPPIFMDEKTLSDGTIFYFKLTQCCFKYKRFYTKAKDMSTE